MIELLVDVLVVIWDIILTFAPCKDIIISIKVNKREGNYCGSN